MKIKLSDYVMSFLKDYGINTIFSVSGGAAAHLLDSVTKYDFNYVSMYHEQASAMACEGYARISNKPALLLVTNGPGSSNTITGVVGAYQDSIPMIVISGQVPSTQTVEYGLRQLGVQELDIIPMVSSITKYSVQIKNANEIKYHLQRALYECMGGRMGPVWLDIPLDIQSTIIDTDDLLEFELPTEIDDIQIDFEKINILLKKSKRPVIIAGNGIHLSKTETQFLSLVNELKIPVITTWTSKDLFNWADSLFVGNFGLLGERAANFTVQKADLLLILGSRLSIPNIGYNSKLFSPNSVKIMVDIDSSEINKKTLSIDYKIISNLNKFLPKALDNILVKSNWQDWIDETQKLKYKYPVYTDEYSKNIEKINSFQFVEVLSNYLKDNHIIVTDMGTSYTCTHQALKTNGSCRLYTSSATCSMGFGLPGAIGSYFADTSKNIILIAGDGGFQMNIQELQTIVHHNIPIKIFILNNNGYLAISLMQDNLFNSNYIGSTPKSGVSSPDFCKIANAYGIDTIRLNNNDELNNNIESILNHNGSILCEIMMVENQLLIPRVQSRKDSDGNIISNSIENMFPFLSDTEVNEIMK